MVEFRYKPVELFGKFDASPASVSSGTQTDILTDLYGRLAVGGGTNDGASTVNVNPILIAGVDASGSISTLQVTDTGLKVDTEIVITPGTWTANVTVFKTYSGSYALGLIDDNRRQEVILASGTNAACSLY